MGEIRNAVVLAAGRGTRLQPVTSDTSKCMLPLLGRPILWHILDTVHKAGITHVQIVVGYRKEKIIDYFGDGLEIGLHISYIEQKTRDGTARAIGLATMDDDFLVLNGDTLVDFEDIEKIMKSHSGDATLGVRRVEDPQQYGVVELEGDRVKSIVEKPREFISDLANAGIYAFSHEIFAAIEKTGKSERGEYEITSSIELLVKEGREVRAVELTGVWSDIGSPWNYLDSNKVLLSRANPSIKGTVEEGVVVKGALILGKGSVIRSGTYIEGPVYIGENSKIGPNTYIRSFTSIGNNSRAGNAVELKNSIIMDNTNISHLSYVGDSIIGSGCNFGAGTLVGNLRLDEKSVKMRIGDELYDTGRRKMGCVVGDNVKTGLNVMINSGRKIGSKSMIGPGVVVYRDIPKDTFVIKKQELEIKELK
ncbi:MAG TPA: glucose-1-phosphate thymidylyltransferase [Euryarchaeota archaeon]|nr:bifunctional protein GlmU [archaeon BMS3Abin16]HDH28414.1 glucose-1-phosphate thymidylyltransferase [Euryarchaeota archaeon]HDY73621.1 glucose-1-phosphate thymidylyltransferase [Euryarchaeota archaeon]